MADMSLQEFRQIVNDIAKPILAQKGYIPSGFQIIDDDHIVPFGKKLVEGVYSLINFQRSRHYVSPLLEFQVFLMREQLTNCARSDVCYAPLGISLRNVMKGLHNVDIFAPNIYTWQFTTKQSLSECVEHALCLVLKYGMSWLESPDSNMDWTKRSG